MKRQIDELVKRYQQSAWNYYHKKQKFEKVKKQYEEAKAQFEIEMSEVTDALGKKSVKFDSDGLVSEGECLTVRKVEGTSIEWYPEKLEKRIPKSVAKKVIKKKYWISNMKGLTEYLKSCGVDPKEFKKFLTIEREVDVKAVDQLGNVGELTAKQISGCYIVKCHKPYFTMSVKKESDDGEEK